MNTVLNEVYLFPNGTIARVVGFNNLRKSSNIKLRCIRYVVGTKRPCTYQRYCNLKSLRKAKRIGTEQILLALFQQRKNKFITKLYR